jgi:hypothetical protein
LRAFNASSRDISPLESFLRISLHSDALKRDNNYPLIYIFLIGFTSKGRKLNSLFKSNV